MLSAPACVVHSKLCTLRETPTKSASPDLESSSTLKWEIRQCHARVRHVIHVQPGLLKLGSDSIIIHHYSYFQGCKWCEAGALMQKLPPISFCKRSACNRAPFPRSLQSNYKPWFSLRACLAGWFHFTFRLTFAIGDVTGVFLSSRLLGAS